MADPGDTSGEAACGGLCLGPTEHCGKHRLGATRKEWGQDRNTRKSRGYVRSPESGGEARACEPSVVGMRWSSNGYPGP